MKEFEKRLKFELSNKDLKLKETLDKDFLELEMYVISNDKPNRNYSHFTEKAMYNSIDSFYNKPVLGYFNLKKDDFEEHNSDLDWDEDTEDLYWSYEAIDAEVPLGLIRESDTVEVVEKNNKKWIKLTCAIWVKYNREKVKRLLKDKKKKVSVEVQVNEAHWEEVENKGEIMFIDSFTFDGVTILGTERGSSTTPVQEGIEGAHLSILDLEDNELFSKRKMALSFAYQKLEENINDKTNTEDGVIFIDKNTEEKEGEETLPNFINIVEGYTLMSTNEDCAIFKKDEKTYSFSLKDVDCTQDIEFSEDQLVEMETETVVVEEKEAETVEVDKVEMSEEKTEEEEKESCEDNKENETEKEENDDEEDEDEPKNDDEEEPEEEKEIKEEEKETADFVVEEETVVEVDEKDEKIATLEAEKAEYMAKITELENEVVELKNKIFKADCEKMVEYANKLMEVRDLTDEEKTEITDNCTKGVYADIASLEKDIAYILFKKGVGMVEMPKANKNFSVSIIQTTDEPEKNKDVFSRLKNK